MKAYKLTPKAEQDLEKIFDYGLNTWGEERATLFLQSLYSRFQWLGENPEIANKRPEIHQDVRGWVHKEYLIFYIEESSHITVVSILRASQDIDSHMRDLLLKTGY